MTTRHVALHGGHEGFARIKFFRRQPGNANPEGLFMQIGILSKMFVRPTLEAVFDATVR